MRNSVGRPVLLYISNDRTAFFERGAEFRAVNVYNKLPVEIKNINSYICLKKLFTQQCYYSIEEYFNIEHCILGNV